MRIIAVLVGIVMLVVGYFWVVPSWNYSTGERAGWVQKLSRKGWLCKTWEGELAMVSMPGAAPEKFYRDNVPYMWPTGPSPDQTSTMVTEFIKKQLVGKPAQYGGADVNGKPRTWTMLTYDTPEGQFKSSWDDLETKLKATGATWVSQ